MQLSTSLLKAIEDARYLLSRGYKRESVVRFVGDRYQLSKEERLLIYRGVYGDVEALSHKEKLVNASYLQGRTLAVDGFNVMLTVEAAIRVLPLYLCDDGFIRDLSAVHGRFKITPHSLQALKLIVERAKQHEVSQLIILFDQPVSHSGELSAEARELLKALGVDGEAKTSRHVDVDVSKLGDIAASSDCVVIEKAEKLFDLAGDIAVNMLKRKPIPLK
ncbi:MAG TPA: DUF434 domain-containing protein [Candidatus Methanomethylia archaeon]|nr:DUF434 domain-containing protein [Candidatus Methanomethylicia archaeon]